jgi:hypothetical protein
MKDLKTQSSNWISFLRQYGPIPRNENMYDEFIRRSAKRSGVNPLQFEHPATERVLEAIKGLQPTSVILTGTAGDGKTHLCRRVWEAIGGDLETWQSPNPYLTIQLGETLKRLHIIRDLSAWVPERGMSWSLEKSELLLQFSKSLFETSNTDIYLIAANDGQLIETWRRLEPSHYISRVQEVLEILLVEDRQEISGVNLKFFNLSRHHSADLLQRALECFLNASGWDFCYSLEAKQGEFFGPDCPVKYNLELLKTPLVQARLRALFSLCDYNQQHLPIRQILLLLVNAVLGHADVKDQLIRVGDVPHLISSNTVARSNLYNNIFGGNLLEVRRESILIFEALNRFGIGHETSNRTDNILIFGNLDDIWKSYFDFYMASDKFYGADITYLAAQKQYIEGTDEDEERSVRFLKLLVNQRRGLFFKIPPNEIEDMGLWDLTVFKFAGEYLDRVIDVLLKKQKINRVILSRLVKGLNRVFTGMLVSDDRELLLATSLALSQGKVSHLLEERISVEARRGEQVDIILEEGASVPSLKVSYNREIYCNFPLYLTRYEFLSRVAEGALPSSFSKECYEDVLAFKSQLLSALVDRRAKDREEHNEEALAFQLLDVEENGKITVQDLVVREM